MTVFKSPFRVRLIIVIITIWRDVQAAYGSHGAHAIFPLRKWLISLRLLYIFCDLSLPSPPLLHTYPQTRAHVSQRILDNCINKKLFNQQVRIHYLCKTCMRKRVRCRVSRSRSLILYKHNCDWSPLPWDQCTLIYCWNSSVPWYFLPSNVQRSRKTKTKQFTA